MTITIQGKVRRRTRVGRGIFRVERWHESPFRVLFNPASVDSGEVLEVGDYLRFCCERGGDRIFVRAEINKRPFILGEFDPDSPKTCTFSVLSVSGYEVSGEVRSK